MAAASLTVLFGSLLLNPSPHPGPLSPHPGSLSNSYLRVDGETIHHRLRCQVLSVLEVLPELDANGDERLSASELDRQLLESYVAKHYTLRVDATDLLAPVITGATPSPHVDDPLDPFRDMDWLDLDFVWNASRPIERLGVQVSIFRETSPDHIDVCTIEGPDGQTTIIILDSDTDHGTWQAKSQGGVLAFFTLGWWHILSGWDHLAFLAALLLATRGLRSLLWVITSFTIAHSITLALVVLDVVDVAGVGLYVEAMIALSIAFVAADNWIHIDRPRTRVVESLLFGLVHGLGFAGFLQESLVAAPSRTSALVLFNLGVEAGQLAVVAATWLLLYVAVHRRSADAPNPMLAPRPLRLLGSAALTVLGLALFFTRVG